jgi:AraC-like DNA-binding protein
MAFARAIVGALRRGGIAPDAALKVAQITPAQLQKVRGRISALQMEWLSGAAMQALDDEALGAYSRRLPWGSYGMLARASLSAPDLGRAIQRWCRHHSLITDDIRLRLITQGASAAIVVDEQPRHATLDADQREFSLVHVLRNILGLSSWFIDSRIALQGASFPFVSPPHAGAYRHMFPGPLRFGAERAEVRFDARYLTLPLRRDEQALGQMLQRALPLTVRQYRRDRLLVQQVRQVLATQADTVHDAEGIAALLNMSTRTLHRQLKDEGASLQQLKDDVRSARARELLQRSARPVKQVAADVGFRNEKSFIRAFRGWTGTSPADYRRRLQA